MGLFYFLYNTTTGMKKLLLPFLWLLSLQGFAQTNTKLPAEAKPFVLKGYEPLDYIKGDINGDGLEDALLVLKIKGEDTLNNETEPLRPLLLLVRNTARQLQLAIRNDSLILCKNCGGSFDPYDYASIQKGNTIIIHFYGGRRFRWGIEYQFAFDANTKTWPLVKQSNMEYDNTSPNQSNDYYINTTECKGKHIGNLNNTKEMEFRTYKVIAAKTFFYTNADLTSQPRKAYLMKGDTVEAYEGETNNFIRVSFTNAQHKTTTGFILKKDLQLISVQ
jgi:hypothetical protein